VLQYLCTRGGKSQQKGDQTYDHKPYTVHRSSQLWDPICPIK